MGADLGDCWRASELRSCHFAAAAAGSSAQRALDQDRGDQSLCDAGNDAGDGSDAHEEPMDQHPHARRQLQALET